MYEVLFYIIVAGTVLLQFICQWYFSKGNLSIAYPLTILVYLCYIGIDVGIVLYNPKLAAILLFSVANIWTLLMSTKGIFRLKKEKQEREQKKKLLIKKLKEIKRKK